VTNWTVLGEGVKIPLVVETDVPLTHQLRQRTAFFFFFFFFLLLLMGDALIRLRERGLFRTGTWRKQLEMGLATVL